MKKPNAGGVDALRAEVAPQIANQRVSNRKLSEIVKQQHKIVAEQEKMAAATELRAKKVVARAKAVRKKADATELSAITVLKESGHK